MKFSDKTRKRRPFNTGDCLTEVTAWAGLTAYNLALHNIYVFSFMNHCLSSIVNI